MSNSAFERYAPFIQEYIYRKSWTDLREVQVEACDAIMDTNKHVIVASGTASGKTEAAFFPILTILEKNPSTSVGVMYIGPLKALINDQFERLNELLDDREVPVWPWHGDISQSTKRKALQVAQGILQITPESLEALLMRHPGDACRLFSDLRFIVIDEIHALMGEDRGLQVLCLIARLEKLTGCRPRRIGLSATLNDYRPAMAYLSAGSSVGAIAVGITSHKRTISLCVESFPVAEDEKQAEQDLQKYYEFLYDNCHTKKCLVFANSRGNVEDVIAHMKYIAKQRGERDVFYVHHGLLNSKVLPCSENSFFICPWCGTREIRTMAKLFSCGLKQTLDIYAVASSYYYLQITSGLSLDEFLSRCRSLSMDLDDPNMVLPQDQTPKIDKYDPMVPEALLRRAFLYNQMDVPSAISILRDIEMAAWT